MIYKTEFLIECGTRHFNKIYPTNLKDEKTYVYEDILDLKENIQKYIENISEKYIPNPKTGFTKVSLISSTRQNNQDQTKELSDLCNINIITF